MMHGEPQVAVSVDALVHHMDEDDIGDRVKRTGEAGICAEPGDLAYGQVMSKIDLARLNRGDPGAGVLDDLESEVFDLRRSAPIAVICFKNDSALPLIVD